MKTADLKRAAPWTKPAALAVATLVLALASTGCNPECVDAYDCRADNGQPPAGQQWTCRNEKCATVPLPGPLPPVDAGTDAGMDAGTDAGMDAGTDAGMDAGTDAGMDAGTDAGTNPCDSIPHDAKLGTLTLQAGFTALESASLPDDVGAVASTPGPTYSLYAQRGSGRNVALYSLGTWPDLETSTRKLYDIVTAEDRAGAADVYPNNFLAYDGKRLVAGYTRGLPGAPGSIALFDITTPANSTYVSAPRNFSADAFAWNDTTALLVNGGGLGATASGLGVYALVTSREPFAMPKVANFPGEAGGSGFTAVARNGIAVLGYYASGANQAHAVPPTVVSQAFTSGTPFALGSQPKIAVGTDFNGVATFGDGVVVNRGAYDASFRFVSTDVSRFGLSLGIGSQTVTIGERVRVLTYDATQCTSMELMAPLGSDLLVGLKDKNGRRLVRIQQAP